MSEARDTSFERVARTYDEARPGYPAELYDAVVAFGGLTLADRVLEVGVGTGKGTLPLAQRGFEILGLEPGETLAGIARANLAAFPAVRIQTTRFEDWPLERDAFGLAFSAQAFHWLDPETRVRKLTDALRPRATLALFGHTSSIADAALRAALDAAYERFAPTLGGRPGAYDWYGSAQGQAMQELRGSDQLEQLTFEAFDWPRILSADAYRALLATYSDHSTLPAGQREALLDAIHAAISERGSSIRLDYRTGLFLARRAE